MNKNRQLKSQNALPNFLFGHHKIVRAVQWLSFGAHTPLDYFWRTSELSRQNRSSILIVHLQNEVVLNRNVEFTKKRQDVNEKPR